MKVNPWPIGIVVFFAAIIGFNIFVATLAANGYQGILDEHPYSKGLKYDAEIEQQTNFVQSGWRATISPTPVVIELRDGAGTPISGAKVTLQLLRPNDLQRDRKLDLSEQEAGRYLHTTEIEQGTWMLNLVVVYGSRTYSVRRILSVTSHDSISLN